jgi:hypothetical protein
VQLWGFFRNKEGFGALYQPPVRALEAPLVVGNTWSDVVSVYLLPDTTYAGSFAISWMVYQKGTLEVPAGTFFVYGIGTTAEPILRHGGSSYSLNGTRNGGESEQWYSNGVGRVQYDTDTLYQLVFYEQPTAVTGVTWGKIKAHFRN